MEACKRLSVENAENSVSGLRWYWPLQYDKGSNGTGLLEANLYNERETAYKAGSGYI